MAVLEIPKHSPDLNVMDFAVWAEVEKRMRRQERAWPEDEGDTPGIRQALGPHSQGVARGLYQQVGFGLQASLRASLQGQGRLVRGRRQGSKVKAQHLGEDADHVAAPRRWQLQEIINSSKNRSRAQAVAFASTQPACGFAKELNLRSCGVGFPMGKLTILRHREHSRASASTQPACDFAKDINQGSCGVGSPTEIQQFQGSV